MPGGALGPGSGLDHQPARQQPHGPDSDRRVADPGEPGLQPAHAEGKLAGLPGTGACGRGRTGLEAPLSPVHQEVASTAHVERLGEFQVGRQFVGDQAVEEVLPPEHGVGQVPGQALAVERHVSADGQIGQAEDPVVPGEAPVQ